MLLIYQIHSRAMRPKGLPLSGNNRGRHRGSHRALTTGTSPGSVLVPTIQSAKIIEILSLYGVSRAIGSRVWPMSGIQTLDIAACTTLPTVAFTGQNSSSSATDAAFGQAALSLKTMRSLSLFSQELFRVAVPGLDSVMEQLIAIAMAETEDTAIFGTTQISNGPLNLTGTSGLSTLLVGGSANGGNLSYSDLTGTIPKAYSVKARGPFA